MAESSGTPRAASAPVLRLTLPTEGEFLGVATELAAKIAEYLGISAIDADSVGVALEGLVGRLAAQRDGEVDLQFRQDGSDLVIHARCGPREADVRYPLPE